MATANTPVTKSAAERKFYIDRREKVQSLSNNTAALLLAGKIQVEAVTANSSGELTSLKLEKRTTTSKAVVEKARETVIESATSAADLDALIAEGRPARPRSRMKPSPSRPRLPPRPPVLRRVPLPEQSGGSNPAPQETGGLSATLYFRVVFMYIDLKDGKRLHVREITSLHVGESLF